MTRLNESLSGGSGETPEPTVKVWMGEGKKSGLIQGSSLPFYKPYFLIAFSKDPEEYVSSGSFLFFYDY